MKFIHYRGHGLQVPFGVLLRRWRQEQRYSQERLSEQIGVSTRHLSFLETGRSQPSRSMVLRITTSLERPKAEVNRALLAAGLAPLFSSGSPDAPALAPVVSAVQRMLSNHQPFPGLVLDRHWYLVEANPAAQHLLTAMGYGAHANLIEAILADDPSRSCLLNWEEVVASILERLRGHRRSYSDDPVLASLEQRLVQRHAPATSLPIGDGVALPTRVRLGEHELAFFSIFSHLETVRDVGMSERTIELLCPLDEGTEAYFRRLSLGASTLESR